MAKLFNKFLIRRRDGSIPKWPWLVLGARDPAAPYAIRALAERSQSLGMDSEFVEDLYQLANEYDAYRAEHGDGDPDAPAHRKDDPDIVFALDSHNATINHRKNKLKEVSVEDSLKISHGASPNVYPQK